MPLRTTGYPRLGKEFVGGLLPLSREGQTLPATWAFDEAAAQVTSPPQPTTTHCSQQDQEQQTGTGAPEDANSRLTQTGDKSLRVGGNKLDMHWHGSELQQVACLRLFDLDASLRAPSIST
jgi:hypothetical protein